MTSEGDRLPEASSMIPAARRERDHATGPRPAGQGPGLPPPQAGVDAAFDARGLARGAGEVEPRPVCGQRIGNVGRGQKSWREDRRRRPAAPRRGSRVHAATSEQRATSQGTEAHAAALSALKKAQPVYDALIGVADPAAPARRRRTRSAAACSPGCKRCSARTMPTRGRAFVVWAQQTGKPPRLLHVLAALAAALEEDWPRVFRHAKTAVAMSQRDLFAQRLFLRARARIDGRCGGRRR